MRVAHHDIVEHFIEPAETTMTNKFNHAAFTSHPVVKQKLQEGFPVTRIRPVALYWDGVQYIKRGLFTGFFYRDLVTNKSTLAFLVRLCLNFI